MSDKPAPIFFDSHMHTPLCGHAEGHPNEYMWSGVDRNLKGIIFTCHSPMPDRFSYRVRMKPEQFDNYVEIVTEAKDAAPDGFEVRLGMESDFFPGMEDWLTELHQRADFDYILGSVHWHIPEYIDGYWTGDPVTFQRQYFNHLAESAESGLFDCLSHPDLVKNSTPVEWKFERQRSCIADALDRISDSGVAMELNTSGLNKNFPEMNPGPEMLAMMAERKIPVVIGSDSHDPGRVGDNFRLALQNLKSAGFEEVSVFQNRKRSAFRISDVEKSLSVDG